MNRTQYGGNVKMLNDNVKKDVHKYEAQKWQALHKTVGGINEVEIKATLQLPYAKIRSIINFSLVVFAAAPKLSQWRTS